MTNPSFVSLVPSKAATAADLTTADVDDIQWRGFGDLLGVFNKPKDANLWSKEIYAQQCDKLSRLTDTLKRMELTSRLTDLVEKMEAEGYKKYLENKLHYFFLLKGEDFENIYKYTIYEDDAKRTFFEAFNTVSKHLKDNYEKDQHETDAKPLPRGKKCESEKNKKDFFGAFEKQFRSHYENWKLLATVEKKEIPEIEKKIVDNMRFLQKYRDPNERVPRYKLDLPENTNLQFIEYKRLVTEPMTDPLNIFNPGEKSIERNDIKDRLRKEVQDVLTNTEWRFDKLFVNRKMEIDEKMDDAMKKWENAAIEYEFWKGDKYSTSENKQKKFSRRKKQAGFQDSFTSLTAILDISKHRKEYVEAKVAAYVANETYRLEVEVIDEHFNNEEETKKKEFRSSVSLYNEWCGNRNF